ncbi:dephospho-CoA kinase [Rhizomicrobium electricum]|uniref:Dephospho-CoA kinase n=1 Tax=Rhizomicrobium electricum TaxID=480070 RepID=A0ABN1F2I2_9PROT|nr:dephospho-CoA kinase [Rhizomicrobium electricum]
MVERPLVVGLTGSIGMGKTATAAMFAEFGIPVYDSDAAVHSLYGPCGEAVQPIEQAFPGTTRDGAVDRVALMAALAKDPDGFPRLEAIVHPLVTRKQREFIAAHPYAELIVLDIPLLFETGGDSRVDVVVVVSAPAEIQRQRALARPGMTEEKLAQILARQMPDLEKCTLADFVVDTSEGFDHARAQVRKIVDELKWRRLQEQTHA